ncbi:MAG: alpha-amylase [Bacteroidaceae bacterium]|nr:alpha-amylase [Bacteroidaceae bacterium]
MEDKIIIYQVLPRLFSNTSDHCIPFGSKEQNGVGKLNHFTPHVLNEIKSLGATHIWYTGVIEHATQTDYSEYGIRPNNPYIVKGKAGSPYAISDYYDIAPDLAEEIPNRMQEYENLIERTHQAGLKVIMDFVPNHVAREYHSDAMPVGVEQLGAQDNSEKQFDAQNNFYYIPRQRFSPRFFVGQNTANEYNEFPARATGNDRFDAFPEHHDWYETVKLNYGVDYLDWCRHHFDPIPDTWYKMRDIILFWCSKGIDGLRCDMVHMVPVEFWHWAITEVKRQYPHIIFIAEIYEPSLYRPYIEYGQFDYLYDKVGLYDKLRAIECHDVSAAQISYCWQSLDGLSGHMLNFLENHDEQRFASMQYAGDATRVLPSLIVSATLSRAPMMIYFGQELGEKAQDAEGFSGHDGRTTIFDYWSVPTVRAWYNEGHCNNDKLTPEQCTLRNLYKQVLTLCNSEKAISQGEFFDLMYVNFDNGNFDPHRHYAYLRYTPDEILLIAVNFGTQASDISINIPALALDMMGIESASYDAIELLSGKRETKHLHRALPFTTQVDGKGAVIWKIKR